jgi:F-type H+-transporting ATPase subunit a
MLNHEFGPLVTRFLHLVHVQPYNARAPITDTFAMEILALLILLAFFLLVRISLNVERPNPIQLTAEMIHEFVSDQANSVIGPAAQRYVMFMTSVLLFILLCNLMGLLPSLRTPTSAETVTLGVALLVFAYYHFQGLRAVGLWGHAKHFLGPVGWIAPLMVPVEIISHFARILSLSVRLYANMFTGEIVTLVFFSFLPFAVPVLFLGLHVFVALIQAYIFMLLAMIYVSEAVAREH